ncbi:MAG TPA: alpha/beta fold hydrolase, partial [Candidatus Nitrosocosmicus sp.]|nr:alpha/beta fold hydrolase [Candidatus Nitrosocosmicus sp.]
MLLMRFKGEPSIILGIFFGTLIILSAYLSSFGSSVFYDAWAQSDIQTVKYRNLTLDLGNGVTTNAQLSYPAIGKGPFPAVLLVPGAGPADMNYTAGDNAKLFWQIGQFLSERGFVVLKYDKRGNGENGTIINNNLWTNMTYNDLKQDAKKAVSVLIQQPEVNTKKISLIGHSEGGEIVTRLATDNSTTKFDNIVLMAPRIENPRAQAYYGFVEFPVEYAKQILDKNHTGSFLLQEALRDQLFQSLVGGNTSLIHAPTITDNNGTKLLDSTSNPNKDRKVNILTELKPVLEKRFEKLSEGSKCENPMAGPCPIYLASIIKLNSTLSIIGNVPSSTDILILHGQNDSGSRVQHAFLLQQKLFELNHPDHTLITYP